MLSVSNAFFEQNSRQIAGSHPNSHAFFVHSVQNQDHLMMRNGLYLLFLILAVFGGGFLVAQQTGIFGQDQQGPTTAMLSVQGQDIEITQSAFSALSNGASTLKVDLAAADETQAGQLAEKMFGICQAVAIAPHFSDRIGTARFVEVSIAPPGQAELYAATLPIENGVCQ